MAKTSPSAHGTGLEPPRSDTLGDASDSKLPSDLTGVSSAATDSQKRGRGRPPKPKSSDSQLNGAVPARKPSGRPRRNRAPAAAVPTSVVKRGRGRPKRSNTLSGTETVVDRSRKRGRPKKDDVAAPAKKRGRKPKSEQVAKRSVGRPKKATERSAGQGAADPKEIKKKSALLQKKVKQAAEKLKIAEKAKKVTRNLNCEKALTVTMVLDGNGGAVWLGGGGGGESVHGEEDGAAHFKPMLEEGDWFSNQPQELQSHHQDFRFLGGFAFNPNDNLLLDSSSSQAFGLDMSHQPSFLAAADNKSCLLNVPSSANPFDNAFEFGSDSGFLGHIQAPMGFGSLMQLSSVPELCGGGGGGGGLTPLESEGFGSLASGGFVGSRAKVLKPLEVLASSGAQPTLFQKRAAMRQSSGRRKLSDDGEVDETGVDVSGLNYESDELNESGKAAESVQNGGGGRGKKKGMPAKNLMAERRRRKKLNDRLYMLRSVVPKISKMDRASILGDAIDYLKELLQRINDLHNELESTPNGSLPLASSSFHPLTPTPQTLSSRVKEELCPSSLPSPKGQQARVEVRLREGRAVNIHMFCGRRPGLLLATMKALDNLGLDVQQAVISCFNGFALDVFRAEQCQEGQEILPDQIKAVLLDTAGYAGMI